jgi:hypothetical protein
MLIVSPIVRALLTLSVIAKEIQSKPDFNTGARIEEIPQCVSNKIK